MGLLLPSRSSKDSKLGIRHWVRVWILIGIVCVLTWYGKIYKPAANISRITDFAVWIFPHKDGLGALVVLPNDNIDTNFVKTGFRLWLSPPDSALAIENGGIRYRGSAIAIIGDSINQTLRSDILSTIDSGGFEYPRWQGELSKSFSGEDALVELAGEGNDYILTVVYEGYKIGFFGSQKALEQAAENTEKQPLSVAILMFNANEQDESLLKNLGLAGEVIGNKLLNYKEAIGLISFSENNGMRFEKLHLKGWKN